MRTLRGLEKTLDRKSARRTGSLALLGLCALGPALGEETRTGIEAPPEWRTPAEARGYEATPSYEEALAFLARVAERVPELRLATFGTSAAGRPMTVAILSATRAFEPAAARASGRPVVLVLNGIHAGEIDGKDASLELLRDLALGRRRELLEAATLLVVPVYNVDGHERVSPYNRPNQDGPVNGMGFRTTADGHDLNRDWLKADTPETRALLALVREWDPHLVIDDHVTNGSDHDWTLTWAAPEAPQLAAPLAAWLAEHLPPALAATEAAGFRTGPYVELFDDHDPSQGVETSAWGARYATGYFAARRRATVLVETHSHKPYARRVAANRELLAALIAEVGRGGRSLIEATRAADAVVDAELILEWRAAPATDRIRFPVYDWSLHPSVVSGGQVLRYRAGEVREIEVPWRHRPEPARKVARPAGYFVAPGWPEIERRLADHGVRHERLAAPRDAEVEVLRLVRAETASRSYQGRIRRTGEFTRERERRRIPAGWLWIPADQPLFDLAALLLEPDGPDSLFAWGMLSTIDEQHEWIGPAELEDEALRLLADPAVKAAWGAALADPAFAADPSARYRWWYRRTPYWDSSIGEMPVLRAIAAPR